MLACPVCGSTEFSLLVAAHRLAEQCRLRERFVNERLARPPADGSLKDLTQFFHNGQADILLCAGCTLLVRKEYASLLSQTYSEESYQAASMECVYPRYLEAFRAKEKPYRALLARGARLLEIGSHYGAFLQTAQEWGWHAEGVDIGKDTSCFARSKGFSVHTREIHDFGFDSGSFDGMFIWNCFEQIADHKPLLMESPRILRPGALLVLRTPNGLFYRLCESLLADDGLKQDKADFLKKAMAYNNLLGFPYLYGHSAATLERLAEPYGFRLEGMRNSELLTFPLPERPKWVEHEERAIGREMHLLERSMLHNCKGALIGPWIELWFRR